jgi:hypothetical protein
MDIALGLPNIALCLPVNDRRDCMYTCFKHTTPLGTILPELPDLCVQRARLSQAIAHAHAEVHVCADAFPVVVLTSQLGRQF